MKYLLLTFSLLLAVRQETTAQVQTAFKVERDAIMEYGETIFSAARYKAGLLTGKSLNGYADKYLQRKYSKEEVSFLGSLTETISLPSPVDPDVWIDTSYTSPFDPDQIKGWVLYAKKGDHLSGWDDVYSVGVLANVWMPGGSQIEKILYFLSMKDLKPTLSQEIIRLLTGCLQYGIRSHANKDSLVITKPQLTAFMEAWHLSASSTIYKAAVSGKIPAYYTDSLTRKYTLTDVVKIGSYCYTMQSPDPKNPDEMVDTMTCTWFDPHELKGFGAAYNWTMKETGPVPVLNSAYLLYSPNIGGVELPPMAMFYFSHADIKKILPPSDWRLMTDIFNHRLLRSTEDGFYWR